MLKFDERRMLSSEVDSSRNMSYDEVSNAELIAQACGLSTSENSDLIYELVMRIQRLERLYGILRLEMSQHRARIRNDMKFRAFRRTHG